MCSVGLLSSFVVVVVVVVVFVVVVIVGCGCCWLSFSFSSAVRCGGCGGCGCGWFLEIFWGVLESKRGMYFFLPPHVNFLVRT